MTKWCLRARTCAVIALAVAALVVSQPALATNGSVSYTYDALGRLATASYDTGVIAIYSYDANGNRTAQVINVNNATGTWGSFTWGAALW